ncbi:hypothetical protein ABK040_011710 [Willaertia magna]
MTEAADSVGVLDRLNNNNEPFTIVDEGLEFTTKRNREYKKSVNTGINTESTESLISTSFDLHAPKHFISGFLSGICTSIVTQPVDCVKTRLQIFRNLNISNNSLSPSFSTFKMVSNIYKEEGIKALYRGLPPSILSTCVSMSMFFTIYQKSRNYFSDKYNIKITNPLVIIPSVLCGWSVSSVLVAPFSLVKVRLQTASAMNNYLISVGQQPNAPTSILNLLKGIYSSEGIAGFYTGYRSFFISASVFCVYFSLYEPGKEFFSEKLNIPLIAVIPFLSPATMIIAATLTYPNDLIMSNLQFQGRNASKTHNLVRYNGWLDAFTKIYKGSGVRGLYAGLSTYLVRVCIGTIASQTAYETFLSLLELGS